MREIIRDLQLRLVLRRLQDKRMSSNFCFAPRYRRDRCRRQEADHKDPQLPHTIFVSHHQFALES